MLPLGPSAMHGVRFNFPANPDIKNVWGTGSVLARSARAAAFHCSHLPLACRPKVRGGSRSRHCQVWRGHYCRKCGIRLLLVPSLVLSCSDCCSYWCRRRLCPARRHAAQCERAKRDLGSELFADAESLQARQSVRSGRGKQRSLSFSLSKPCSCSPCLPFAGSHSVRLLGWQARVGEV